MSKSWPNAWNIDIKISFNDIKEMNSDEKTAYNIHDTLKSNTFRLIDGHWSMSNVQFDSMRFIEFI